MADDGNHHFGAVDETTKRLVGRCGRVAWLQPQAEEEDGEESQRSPTKMKQRMLSVSMSGAMGSSLSVVEVAAQTSKPGVKTPSRSAEAGRQDEVPGGDSGGPNIVVAGEGTEAVVSAEDGVKATATDEEKSPFEVEGEA